MKTILPDALAEISRLNRAAGETVVNPTVTAGLIELEAWEAKVDAVILALETAANGYKLLAHNLRRQIPAEYASDQTFASFFRTGAAMAESGENQARAALFNLQA